MTCVDIVTHVTACQRMSTHVNACQRMSRRGRVRATNRRWNVVPCADSRPSALATATRQPRRGVRGGRSVAPLRKQHRSPAPLPPALVSSTDAVSGVLGMSTLGRCHSFHVCPCVSSSVCLYVCLLVCLAVGVALCMTVCLLVCMSGWLSVCLSVWLSVCP